MDIGYDAPQYVFFEAVFWDDIKREPSANHYLVGGLEHFDDFPFSRECHHPKWLSLTQIFQRGRVQTTNQITLW